MPPYTHTVRERAFKHVTPLLNTFQRLLITLQKTQINKPYVIWPQPLSKAIAPTLPLPCSASATRAFCGSGNTQESWNTVPPPWRALGTSYRLWLKCHPREALSGMTLKP